MKVKLGRFAAIILILGGVVVIFATALGGAVRIPFGNVL